MRSRRSSPAPRRSGPSDLASARGRACPQLEGVSDRRRCRGIRHRRGCVRRDGGGCASARGDGTRRCVVRAVRRRRRRRRVATGPPVRRSASAGRRLRDRFLLHRAVSIVRLSGLGELPRDRDVHRDRRLGRRDPRGDPSPCGDFGDRAQQAGRGAGGAAARGHADRPGRPARGGVRRGRSRDARARRG